MNSSWKRCWWTLFVLSLTGCQWMFPKHGIPQDPLFVHRAPVEAKTESPAATAVASAPEPPANPYFALNKALPAIISVSRQAPGE